MSLLTFMYTHEAIFEAVKQESSLYAVRQADNEGNPMFNALIFDEAYLSKFRELFFNAQAQIIPALSAYMKDIPAEPEYFERRDFDRDRDFICYLEMPDDFNRHISRNIEDYIFNFLKDWIMYKWLETKMPEVSIQFRGNCEEHKSAIKGALEIRTQPRRRKHVLF